MYSCTGYATEIKRTMKYNRDRDARVPKARTKDFADGTPIQ
jgi:hypothetical protein